MGSFMHIKVEVKKEEAWRVLERFSGNQFSSYAWEEEDWMDLYIFGWWGYAEPLEFYEKNKDFVKDVWWLSISDPLTRPGRNKPTKWWSCKKESRE